MEIRQATPRDIGPLLALYRELQPDDPALQEDLARLRLGELLQMVGSGIFIGWIGEQAVTTCTLAVIPNLTRGGAPYGLIENVVTHSTHRKRGYGKQILQAAIDAAWKANCYKVMLMTGSTNPATLAFYENAGFEQSKAGFQVRRIGTRAD